MRTELKDLARRWAETKDHHVQLSDIDDFIDWLCLNRKDWPEPLENLPVFKETAKMFTVNQGGSEKQT